MFTKHESIGPNSIQDLANLFVLGRGHAKTEAEERLGTEGNRCGRAVFLIGAGCSVTAGIPPGAEVAKRCAAYLAGIYEAHDRLRTQDDDGGPQTRCIFEPQASLDWLKRNRGVPTFEYDARPDWGEYYKYFFSHHFSSINQQRAFVDSIIGEGKDRLNWEHACLGELVARRYVHTVLTTNFDQLVLQGIIRTGQLPVVADGIEALNRVTAEPRRPQIVHLHGSMHTYNPRNTPIAVSETGRDPTLRSMLYTILHRCDVLVVVGYAGGEEGVMRLLIDAARQLPPLVVYWVMRDYDGELSPLACELMSIGENKICLRGYSAAELFQGLMNELKIGEPAWLSDPIQTLRQQRDQLTPASEVNPEVGLAIERFGRRVDEAERALAATPRSIADRAAEMRLRGRYRESLDILREDDARAATEMDLLTLRAANRFSVAEMDDGETEFLGLSIKDFSAIVAKARGAERARWAVQLFRALMLLYERTKDTNVDAKDRVREILNAVDRPEDLASDAPGASVRVDLHRLMGQAFLDLGEEEDKLQEIQKARLYFEKAFQDLAGPRDRRWAEVQTGLATSLQILGSRNSNADEAREAVSILRALASSARGSDNDRAGLLVNLAGALVGQADIMDPPGRAQLRDAHDCLVQAIEFYRAIGADSFWDAGRAEEQRLTLLRRLES